VEVAAEHAVDDTFCVVEKICFASKQTTGGNCHRAAHNAETQGGGCIGGHVRAVRDWSGMMPATKNEKEPEAKQRRKYAEGTWRILRIRTIIRSQKLRSGEKMRLRDEVASGFHLTDDLF
jgi:hypothetical protein